VVECAHLALGDPVQIEHLRCGNPSYYTESRGSVQATVPNRARPCTLCVAPIACIRIAFVGVLQRRSEPPYTSTQGIQTTQKRRKALCSKLYLIHTLDDFRISLACNFSISALSNHCYLLAGIQPNTPNSHLPANKHLYISSPIALFALVSDPHRHPWSPAHPWTIYNLSIAHLVNKDQGRNIRMRCQLPRAQRERRSRTHAVGPAGFARCG
jgi:hypothetical protein